MTIILILARRPEKLAAFDGFVAQQLGYRLGKAGSVNGSDNISDVLGRYRTVVGR